MELIDMAMAAAGIISYVIASYGFDEAKIEINTKAFWKITLGSIIGTSCIASIF